MTPEQQAMLVEAEKQYDVSIRTVVGGYIVEGQTRFVKDGQVIATAKTEAVANGVIGSTDLASLFLDKGSFTDV